MEDFTPMDPEFTEETPQSPEKEELPCHYGTGRLPKPPQSHFFLVVMLLFLLMLANLVTILVFQQIKDGKQTETQTPTDNTLPSLGPDDTTATAQSEVPSGNPEGGLQIQTEGHTGDPLSLQEIYAQVQPSLVGIAAQTETGTRSSTGVILSSDGYILANAHILQDGAQISVTAYDKTVYAAEIIGVDQPSDLALLKIDAENLQAAEFGDSDTLLVGDEAVAISNPFGAEYSGTMTSGYISAITGNVNVSGMQMQVIQTNAALDADNSGGPLINSYGQIVGMNVDQIGSYVSYESVEGIGFAVPIQEIREIIDELYRYGYVSGRASLGVEVKTLSETQRLYWNLPQGVIITEIYASSSAYLAGLRVGDIIIGIDDVTVKDLDSYTFAINSYQTSQTVRVYIYRDGSQYYADIVLDEAAVFETK